MADQRFSGAKKRGKGISTLYFGKSDVYFTICSVIKDAFAS